MNPISNGDAAIVYNDLANKYSFRKRESMINILSCGELLYNAKISLNHGMFSKFLEDSRVAESERTAQRLLSVYKNFGHLLVDAEEKVTALERLGISHLLELQKLPKRFRKEFTVEKEVNGEMVTEKFEVIDENKLADFLDKNVTYNGEKKHVRDLPVEEMKKYINEASGIYEPTKEQRDDEIIQNTSEQEFDLEDKVDSGFPVINGGMIEPEDDVVEIKQLGKHDDFEFIETKFRKFRTKLADLTILINDIVYDVGEIKQRDDLHDLSVDLKQAIKKEIAIVKDKSETIIMRMIDMGDFLG